MHVRSTEYYSVRTYKRPRIHSHSTEAAECLCTRAPYSLVAITTNTPYSVIGRITDTSPPSEVLRSTEYVPTEYKAVIRIRIRNEGGAVRPWLHLVETPS